MIIAAAGVGLLILSKRKRVGGRRSAPGVPSVPVATDLTRLSTDRAARAGWARRHRRGLDLVGLVIALFALTGYLWVRTHPPTLEVGTITASIDTRSVALSQGGSAVTAGYDVPVRVLVDLHAAPPAGMRVQFLGLGGPATVTPNLTATAVDGNIQAGVQAEVACGRWHSNSALSALLSVSDGRLTREVQVPVDGAGRSVADQLVRDACATYGAAHPLRLTALGVTLSAPEPRVQMLMTLSNQSDAEWSLDGKVTLSSDGPPAPLWVTVAAQDVGRYVAGHAVGVAMARVMVTSCAGPEPLDPSGRGQHLSLEVRSRYGRTRELDVPPADLALVFDLAHQACVGSPTVEGADILFSRTGSGRQARVVVHVQFRVSDTSGWVARVFSPSWLPQGGVPQDDSQPLVVQSLQAPTLVTLALPTLSGCPPDGARAAPTIPLTLTGTLRNYPYLAVVPPWELAAGGPCPAR